MNIYKSSDGVWFLLVVSPDKIPALAEGIGLTDLLRDPRFADPAKLAANMGQLRRYWTRSLARSLWRTGAKSSTRPT